MSWKHRFLPGSFRGVNFYVEAHDAEAGRRNVPHQYPKRNDPFTEDMGRRARRFSVFAYVVGEDYDLQRDALVDACEEDGPGRLVHPYLGTHEVICDLCVCTEARDETRMARFTLIFVERGEQAAPSSTTYTAGLVASATRAASSLVSSAFDRLTE